MDSNNSSGFDRFNMTNHKLGKINHEFNTTFICHSELVEEPIKNLVISQQKNYYNLCFDRLNMTNYKLGKINHEFNTTFICHSELVEEQSIRNKNNKFKI